MAAMISAHGRLGVDPRAIPSGEGKSMTVASMAIDGGGREKTTLWLGLVAFGRLADDLLRHCKSDPISVTGRLEMRRWVTPDGMQREQWQAVIESLLSARTVARDYLPVDDSWTDT
jgi:single-strand DNA-binding protein